MTRSRFIRPLMMAALVACVVLLPASPEARNKVQYDNFHWKVLNTPHFEIFFYDGAENLAARAAVIAEDAYRRLSIRFSHEFKAQIPFILYASPNDFQQTNISAGLIGEGTGGFSEPLRNRMVLPYPGDNAAFVHVINHELVHVFMFDVAFKSTASGAARRALFPIELWFAEGAAEWFSHEGGWDKNTDMWMRDATIYDWIVPLDRIYGGYQVYRQGQAAMRYMAETYGDEKTVEFFKAVGRTRNVSRALQMVIGLNTAEFSEKWMKWLQREYWPQFQDRLEADQIGRRMTNHAKDYHYFAQQPTLSPDGNVIAFFSDRENFVKLFLMDVVDGEILATLATGYRSDQFLSFHSFDSGMSFSPEGDRLAFIAKSGGRETLYVIRVPDGKILQSIRLGVDIARDPAWSPISDQVALVGSNDGLTDILLVDLKKERITRITDNISSEFSPSWMPDGRRVVYSAYPNTVVDVDIEKDANGDTRMTMVDFDADGNVTRQDVSRDIYVHDLRTGLSELLLSTRGDDSAPVAVDENNLIFVSDASGISNLYHYSLETRRIHRFTDVLTGIFQPSVSVAMNRLVFTAFTNAGYDIFLMENASEYAASHHYSDPLDLDMASGEPRIVTPPAELTEGTNLTVKELLSDEPLPHERGGTLDGEQLADGSGVPSGAPSGGGPVGPAASLGGGSADSTAMAEEDPTPLTDKPIGKVEKYRLRFSLDPLGGGSVGGIYYTSGLGLGFANLISLSDLLGNHRMEFLVNFYGSIKDSDLSASYYYLKRRINVGAGVFHYRNFFNSNFTTLGEVFDRSRFFSERNYGFFGIASRPFSTFDRLDFEVQAFVSDRTFYEFDPNTGFYVETERVKAQLLQPSLSLIHDSAFYGPNGPVTGSKWVLNFSPAAPIGDNTLDRITAFADYRKYFLLFNRSSVAFRLMGAYSNGGDPRIFVLGGPFTLRGWDTFDFEKSAVSDDWVYQNLIGTRMALMNLEYRFPAVDAVFFGWPGSFGLGGIGGVVFLDVGSAFTNPTADNPWVPFGETEFGNFRLQDLKANYGFGLRMNFGWLPLKFDWAWKTDFARSYGDVKFTFSIGPEF